ncbi:L,D-transpeptidase family protein [Nonomuraea sp. NPDC049709]|uniref:L,D-transpeptidase family protein n=1 Tax=Nonomuraea sp. NPDC049709 TaxID=3154736 RepID=UPI00343FD931
MRTKLRGIVALGVVVGISCGLPVAAAADTPDTTDTEAVKGVVLRPGDRGEAVRLLQRRLHAGRYYYGRIHGVYDEQTKLAVWALQKSRRMMPQGEIGPQVWKALDRPFRWRPLVPEGGPDRVEINLREQLLTVYRDRRPVLFSHISSGAEVRYCKDGRCGNAITPVGNFRVSRRAPGWTTGRLGSMFNSLYFTGGIAMHGSTRVPLRPASHGCVRLPIETSKRLYEIVKIGEPVYVRGGFDWSRDRAAGGTRDRDRR